MTQETAPTGYWFPITSEASAREAVKMGGLPLFILGFSMLILAITIFSETVWPIGLAFGSVALGIAFIIFAFRIRQDRPASLPYLIAIFLVYVIVEFVVVVVLSVGIFGAGLGNLMLIVATHLVTFLAVAFAVRGLQGWRYLKRAGLPMRL